MMSGVSGGFVSRMPPGSFLLWLHLLLSRIMRTVHWLNAFTCKRQMLSDPSCQKNSQNKPFNKEQLVSCWLQTVGNSLFAHTLLFCWVCVHLYQKLFTDWLIQVAHWWLLRRCCLLVTWLYYSGSKKCPHC